MKKLYLHIGIPKTGTTSLQQCCGDNRELMEKRGYCYPIFPYKYSNATPNRNGHFMIGEQYDARGARDYKEEKRVFEEGMDHIRDLFTKHDNVVLSDEILWRSTLEKRKELWEQLKERGQRDGYQVIAVVYLRRQDEYVSSWWKQQVKTLTVKRDFDRYVKAPGAILQMDYYEKLESIAKVLGKENIIVRRFDRKHFVEGSLYMDFFHTIGLSLSQEELIPTAPRNDSLNGNTNEIKRVLNTLPELEDKGKNAFFRKVLLECTREMDKSYVCSDFSREEREDFLAEYAESNRRVAVEYLDEEEGQLFDNTVPDIPKWQKDNPYMQDDIIRFIGRTTSYLLDENEKLRKEIKKLQAQPTLWNLIKKVWRKIKSYGKFS